MDAAKSRATEAAAARCDSFIKARPPASSSAPAASTGLPMR